MLKFIKSIPSSAGDLFIKIIVDNYSVTNIVWIDTLLVTIATTFPSLIFLIILILDVDFKIDKKVQAVITGGLTILILLMFQSLVFWIIIASIIIVTFGLIIHSRFVKTEKI